MEEKEEEKPKCSKCGCILGPGDDYRWDKCDWCKSREGNGWWAMRLRADDEHGGLN